VDEPGFDIQGLFDQDYLHFYADVLGDERSDADTELLWRLLKLDPAWRSWTWPAGMAASPTG